MMTFITIGQGRRNKETGEPDDAISVTSGSEGGRGKRPAMDLARGLPDCALAKHRIDEQRGHEQRILKIEKVEGEPA